MDPYEDGIWDRESESASVNGAPEATPLSGLSTVRAKRYVRTPREVATGHRFDNATNFTPRFPFRP